MAKKVVRDEITGRVRVYTEFTKPSRTQQQFKDETDINNIMARYEQTGQITHIQHRVGQYADFSGSQTLFESMLLVQDAQQMFLQLPAQLRNRFENDPVKLLQFLEDKNNRDEAIKLGLIDKQSENDSTVINDDDLTTTKNSKNKNTSKNDPIPKKLDPPPADE